MSGKQNEEEKEIRIRAIKMLLFEVTGKEIEVTEKVYKIYNVYSYENLVAPLIDILRSKNKTYGEISMCLKVPKRRVSYIVTGK